MEKFTIGLLLGGVGGALLAANSCKMRMLVRKGQEEIKQRLDEMMDEKLKETGNGGKAFCGCSENGESGEKTPDNSESQRQGKDDVAKERGK